MFKRILSAAALAGVMSGVLLTVIQQIEIVPLIEAAEAREAANVASHTHQHSEANQSWTPPLPIRPSASAVRTVPSLAHSRRTC
jgi:predicted cobalt transporter CbtA